jgi:hypothetical protein
MNNEQTLLSENTEIFLLSSNSGMAHYRKNNKYIDYESYDFLSLNLHLGFLYVIWGRGVKNFFSFLCGVYSYLRNNFFLSERLQLKKENMLKCIIF